MTLVEILAGANVALKVLQARLLVMISMLLSFSLFAWAMWLESQLALIIAAAFAVSVFLPVLFTTGERHAPKHSEPATRSLPAATPAGEPGWGTDRNDLAQRDYPRAAAS
jgi:hypothetical protein